MKLSCAVTVRVNCTPGEMPPGAETASLATAAGPTVILPEVPVIVLVTVSVAVIVRVPAVFSVALKVPWPLVSVEFAGRTAEPSVLVKCTVPL